MGICLSMTGGCSSLQANRNRCWHCNLHCRNCNLHPDPHPHHHPSLCWRAMHNSTRVAILAKHENNSTLIALCMENGQATSPLLLSQGLFWLESNSHCDPQPDKTNTCNETKPDNLFIYIYMYIRHEIHPVTRRAVVQHYIYIYNKKT